MIRFKKLNIEEIRELFDDYYFKKGMEANINHILFDMNCECKFELNADSENSYSTNNLIHVGLPKECIGMTQEKIYAVIKALVGHEASHIKWSNFNERANAIERYQEKGGNWLLYSAISNILEDGRVERLLCEQLRGFRKYIKFANKVLIIQNDNASLVDEDIVINLTRTIHYLAVIGKYPSNYNKLFSNSQRQLIEKEIAPRILDSVSSDSFKTVLDMTEEIIEIMDSMIDKELDEKETDFLKQLSRQTYNSSNGKDNKNKKNSSSSSKSNKELDSKENNSNNEGNQSEDGKSKGEQSIGNNSNNNVPSSLESKSNNTPSDDNKSGNNDKVDSCNKDSLKDSQGSGNIDNSVGDNEGLDNNSDNKSSENRTNQNQSNNADSSDNKSDNNKLDKGNKAGRDEKRDSSDENNVDEKGDSKENQSNNADSKNQSESSSSSINNEKSSSMSGNSQEQSPSSLQPQNNTPVNHIGSEDYDKSFLDSDILDRKMFRELERLIDRESKTALETMKLKADRDAREQEELSEIKGPIDYHSDIDLDNINSHYNSKTKEPNFKYQYPDVPYEVAPAEFNMDIRILENEFKKLLNYRQTTARNQKKGRLDSNKLWKLSMHDGNVFYKENNNKNGGCAVYILIDLSGSTLGTKYELEMATAICIEGALMNIPDVEVKTVGFSHFYNDSMGGYRASRGFSSRYIRDETGYSCMRVFKDFKEKRSKTPYAYKNSFAGGDNRDGFAIRVALDELNKHSAKNKLLLILSDGMPAWRGESREEAMTDVKNAVHEGRKSTTIMSILLNEGEIDEQTKDCFNYMYEDRGNIMVDVTKEPKNIMKYLSLYLRRVLKRR